MESLITWAVEFFTGLAYFILVIGVLVIVHEWGHFAAARLTGMRADVFAFGMGRRLFGYNKRTGFTLGSLPADFDFDGITDWRWSMWPVGGYVKVAGMIDESFDTEFANKEPEDWEFRSKNTIQKAFVLSAGVIMNIILTIVIFSYATYTRGESSLSVTDVAYVHQDGLADKIGIEANDKILSINGKEISSWEEILMGLSIENFSGDLTISLLREGKELELKAESDGLIQQLSEESSMEKSLNQIVGLDPMFMKVYFNSVLSLTPAHDLGLQAGDTVISINKQRIRSTTHFKDIVQASKNKVMTISWKRGDKTKNAFIKSNKDDMIGVSLHASYLGETSHIDYDFLSSISKGKDKTIELTNLIFNSVGEMINGNIEFKKAVAGPITIAKQSAKTGSKSLFELWILIAQLSISLALINILPIPALDGGHLLFVLYEGITRKEVPVKVKMAIQNIGFFLLLGLMGYILILDVMR